MATGWHNWRSLRADGRRSAAEAERVVVYAASRSWPGTPGTAPLRSPMTRASR